jgi:hypothetical protein
VDGYTFHAYKTSPGEDVFTDVDLIADGYDVGVSDTNSDLIDPVELGDACDLDIAGCIGFDSQFRYIGRVKAQVGSTRRGLAAAAGVSTAAT